MANQDMASRGTGRGRTEPKFTTILIFRAGVRWRPYAVDAIPYASFASIMSSVHHVPALPSP